MTTATTTASPGGKPKRERKAPGPMTATKAISMIDRLRKKAAADEVAILDQLSPLDRARVHAFANATAEDE